MQVLDVPVSDKLRERIEESGLSQSELSRESGVPQPSISRFMRGERGLSIEYVDKLAEYFGLTLADETPKRRRPKK
jgi:transcriptional regulator with XRE-family HTH domain